MEYVKLGKTGITTPKNGFGALPVQRVSMEEAVKLLRKAYDNNITFFDTARWYTDSEEKLGRAFKGLRSHIYIASKTGAKDAAGFRRDLETSLTLLGTDYLDLYQFHNPAFCPVPGGEDGLYDAMLQAKKQGKIRHIGITNHRLSVANEAVAGGWYETLQFPFSYLATEVDVMVVRACEKADMGFLAMKALSGGLITNARAAYAYLAQYPGVLPIWGIQRERELDEFLQMNEAPARMDDELAAVIEADRKTLAGSFCRGCGYCMPCPAGIEINNCARISLLLRRSPTGQWFSEENQAKMNRIEDCLHCGQCESRCPYGLNTQALLMENLRDYREMLAAR
ncbi:MAG: aldo/keto reductase [Eubacteriales bacterium]|nr:aldo/keto reductase [Eubacteriales bacterium]